MTQDTTIAVGIATREASAADRWLNSALMCLVVLWGVNFVVIKTGLKQFDPMAFCALRQLMGMCVLIAILIARRGWVRMTSRDVFVVLPLMAIAIGAGQITFHVGMASTTATNSALIVATMPMTVALTNHILRLEHLKAQNWAGICLSLAGIGLIFGGEADLGQMSTHFEGNLWILMSNVCWVTYIVMARPVMRRIPPLLLTALCMAIGLPLVGLMAAPELITTPWSTVTWGGWAAVLFAGVVAFGIGQVIWTKSIHKLGSTRTAVYGNVVSVVGVVAAYLFLNERMTAMQMIGGASVIVGVIMAQRGHDPVDEQREN